MLTSSAALTLLGLAATARAQSPRIELGVDAMLAVTSVDLPRSSSITTFDFPIQAFRMGFELTPRISLEPALGLHTVSGDGSFHSVTFDLGLPIELAKGGSPGSDYFLRPLFGVRSFSGEGSSATQSSFGIGIGARIPIIPRLAARFEARYRRGLKNDDFAAFDEFGLLGGLSFFTR